MTNNNPIGVDQFKQLCVYRWPSDWVDSTLNNHKVKPNRRNPMSIAVLKIVLK